ncbi:MAG: hypothetical protein KTR31_15820 [Myxococcales bacterium]|nr:hypothetical protein [Myxococcales bacterium]
MKTTLTSLSLLFAVGCAQSTTVISDTLPGDGVVAVFADNDRGNFTYTGGNNDGDIDIEARLWGTGSSRSTARQRANTNDWGALVSDGLLDMWGRSSDTRTGVHLSAVGPTAVDVESVLLDGTARVSNVEGRHLISANRVEGTNIVGDVDFFALTDGMNVEVYPGAGDTVRLEAFGDVFVQLPYGLEYDIEAFLDPRYGDEALDLGFDDYFFDVDYLSAVRGSGAIRVEIYVVDGSLFLWEARPRQIDGAL